ncbi:MAG: energy-converting hydrogenase A, subunit R [Deltaproteobacteria bacterium]|nr:energy-converting hydrogenase A, subunit R [Deltaproteobacteria bacterium]
MPESQKRVFVTDCEGPVTKNDNAAELAEAFIPEGESLFRKISIYDDYLAEIARKPGYKAGNTLKLILPFLKAFGVDDRSMRKFSRRNIQMIPFADKVLGKIHSLAPSYIVSTSYSPYIQGVCDVIGFPLDCTFSTQVTLDNFDLSDMDKKVIRDAHKRILELPDIKIPEVSHNESDMDEKDLEIIGHLNKFFWYEFPNLEIYNLVESVNPIGGLEKAQAINEIVEVEGSSIENVVYVGDSITDVEAFRLVRNGGGLAVSFNGNNWAVREAMIALTGSNALVIEWIATAFILFGPDSLTDLMIQRVTDGNLDDIITRSSQIRKTVRTEKIAALG